MSTLSIRIVRQPGGEAADAAARPLNPVGMSIGRSPDCDLVLDDPLRLVSRRHAWLVPSDRDKALIHCVSASASLTVNGVTVPSGGECQLEHGDRVCIGAFELLIEAQRPAEVALLELARHVSPPPALPVAAPVAVPVAAHAAPAAARPRLPASRLDQWFDLDTVADPLAPDSPLARVDPMPAAGAARGVGASPAAPVVPERVAQPAPSPAVQPASPVRPASTDPRTATLREAFLRGAGLADDATLEWSPEWAEHLGALLRGMTEGTFDLLRSRAVTKQSIRAEGTQIVARENNPLKFAPDATECLRLLLRPQPRAGFLAPVEALHVAHRDLQVHQLAMMAGMRAAVSELILRLGPEAIEQAAGPARGWKRLVPGWRDADLWRRHREHHADLLANLDDALEAAFGREFLLAYEAQSRQAGSRHDSARRVERPL